MGRRDTNVALPARVRHPRMRGQRSGAGSLNTLCSKGLTGLTALGVGAPDVVRNVPLQRCCPWAPMLGALATLRPGRPCMAE